jgi:dihydroorotase
VRLAINLAATGEAASGGCFADPAASDVAACVGTIRHAGPLVWGIAVNLSPFSCGRTDPRWVLDRALEAAEATGRPLLFGPRRGTDDFPLAEQLGRLRAGDVVTYCFHGQAEGLLEGGRVRDGVWRARERGILFDVGHGAMSFDFGVAETAISQGFRPDTISSDYHRRHVGVSPRHDLPRTMAKMRAAGMSFSDILSRVTSRPAAVLGLAQEIGHLAPGACADLAVLRWLPLADPPLADTAGVLRPGGCWTCIATVCPPVRGLPLDMAGEE